MTDRATPNLPSRDFDVTVDFYGALGFEVAWRDAGWLILKRGDLQLEFFPHPAFDPEGSGYGSCLRVADVAELVEVIAAAGVPEQLQGRPCFQRPKREAWGGLVGYMVDPDRSLPRLIQE